MNYSLAYSSIGFYQLAKLLCIPAVIIIEYAVGMESQHLSPMLVGSIAIIILGMVLVVEQQITVNPAGLVWTTAAIICTAAAQVFFAPLKRELQLDSLQLFYHTAPWLSASSIALIPVFENIKGLERYTMTSEGVFLIFLSCVLAVGLNITNYLVLTSISPLSYTIMGHLKTILIITFGAVFFDSIPSGRTAIGMFIAMLGVSLYSWLMHKAQQPDQKVIANVSSSYQPVSTTESDSNKQ